MASLLSQVFRSKRNQTNPNIDTKSQPLDQNTSDSESVTKIALYFYYAFLDEGLAQQAARKAIAEWQSIRVGSRETSVDLVRLTHKWRQKKSFRLRPTSLAQTAEFIVLPKQSNWGPWFELRKTASDNDVEALIYSRLLGLSYSDIARGLDLPVGTIRYRAGQALRSLGHICRSTGGLRAGS